MDVKPTVLYVDDEDVNLFIFKARISKKFDVLTSISPTSALEELDVHKDKIVAVISDMHMPIMNGVKFIREAKKKHAKIAYYILTGFDFNEEIENALNEKLIRKYFTKPFNIEEIEAEVNMALNK